MLHDCRKSIDLGDTYPNLVKLRCARENVRTFLIFKLRNEYKQVQKKEDYYESDPDWHNEWARYAVASAAPGQSSCR